VLVRGSVGVCCWPISEATAARRHGCLLGVNLPAASAFVNPDSAHHGPRRKTARPVLLQHGNDPPPRPNDAGGAIGRESLDCRRGGEQRQHQAYAPLPCFGTLVEAMNGAVRSDARLRIKKPHSHRVHRA
jgi:hypothetical protein